MGAMGASIEITQIPTKGIRKITGSTSFFHARNSANMAVAARESPFRLRRKRPSSCGEASGNVDAISVIPRSRLIWSMLIIEWLVDMNLRLTTSWGACKQLQLCGVNREGKEQGIQAAFMSLAPKS